MSVLLELAEEYCIADHHEFDVASVRRALIPLLDSERHGAAWTIHVDGEPRVEGYACVTWGYSIEAGGPEALFDELFVRRRGLGIGSRAMQLVLDEVRSSGYARIYLETEAHNHDGRRLYERLGFVTEDSVWMSLDWRDDQKS